MVSVNPDAAVLCIRYKGDGSPEQVNSSAHSYTQYCEELKCIRMIKHNGDESGVSIPLGPTVNR